MKKYIPFYKAGMMEEMAYKAVIFSWIVVALLQFACVIFLWQAVYANSTEAVINGFTFRQMVVYFVFSNILSFTTMSSPTLFDINEEIKDGTIAISFIKPISYRFRFLYRAFGVFTTRFVMFGLPMYIVSIAIFVHIGFLQIESAAGFAIDLLLFLLCLLLAVALFDSIQYICGVLCFYTTAAWGLNQAKEVLVNFFSGVFIPISFFPGIFGKIAQQLPFAGMVQNPVLILTHAVSHETALLYIVKNLVWLMIFEIIAKLLFNHASKKVTVQGG